MRMFFVAPMSARGLPSTIVKSASLPGSMLPHPSPRSDGLDAIAFDHDDRVRDRRLARSVNDGAAFEDQDALLCDGWQRCHDKANERAHLDLQNDPRISRFQAELLLQAIELLTEFRHGRFDRRELRSGRVGAAGLHGLLERPNHAIHVPGKQAD